MADEDDSRCVILVDENDNQTGTAGKMEAHLNGGKLHRAFSVIITDSKGRIMLQKRASAKYHSQGLWTNTCCSHPEPGESTEDAAHRRLKEEMGFDTPLKEVFSFVYKATLDTGLTEHEYDHVFIGTYDGVPVCDPAEVEDWRLAEPEELRMDMNAHPEEFSEWFRIIINRYFGFISK